METREPGAAAAAAAETRRTRGGTGVHGEPLRTRASTAGSPRGEDERRRRRRAEDGGGGRARAVPAAEKVGTVTSRYERYDGGCGDRPRGRKKRRTRAVDGEEWGRVGRRRERRVREGPSGDVGDSIRFDPIGAPDGDDVHPAAAAASGSDFPEVAAQVAVASDSTFPEVDANERREPAGHVGRTLGGPGARVATANLGG